MTLKHPPFKMAPSLSALNGISHGFFGREGGVSKGLYTSLNTGPGSDDDPFHIAENRVRVGQTIGAQPEALISLHQHHSADVIEITSPVPTMNRPMGDAMVTKTPNLALCVLTADCTPVLFADEKAGVIGAAHAGWKGALGGVLENTLAAMIALGAKAESTIAAIGPSLSQTSFEVGPDLKSPFLDKHSWSERFFEASIGDRAQFDIWGFCKELLTQQGVSKIDVIGEDTLSQPALYFSNRARVKTGLPDYGRNASVIMLQAQ